MKNDSAIVEKILGAVVDQVKVLQESGDEKAAVALADSVDEFKKAMDEVAKQTGKMLAHNVEMRERLAAFEKREAETNVLSDCCGKIDRLDIEGQMRVSAYLALRYNPRGFARLINSRHEAPASSSAEAG